MTKETRMVMCGEAAGDQVDAADVLRLRNLEPNRNVNLHINDISRSLYRDGTSEQPFHSTRNQKTGQAACA
jgi:hypothetical protein